MDDKRLRHLRQLTSELRNFTVSAGADFERIIDSMDTVIDDLRTQLREPRSPPELLGAQSYLSQLPEWLVIYDRGAEDRAVWYNPALERVFGVPLEKALSRGLCRRDLLDEGRSQPDIGGVAIYAIPSHQDAVGTAHPFEFFHNGVQYLADITFDFDHYATTLYGDVPHPLQRTEWNPEKACPVDGLLDAVMDNLPLPAALKYPDGSIAWCNLEYLSLVRKISPRWRRFHTRDQLYGETSVRLFDLGSEQAQALTNIETQVVDQGRPLIAYDYIRSERRLTLRFPILDQRRAVRFFGVLSMPD